MAQDIAPPPSAAALASAATGPVSERKREYYTDMPCAEGQGCGGEGVVLPFEPGRTDLDEMFGFTDVEALPLSDEVLPVIFDGALLTEEGLLDCFARHYPERAAFLLQLLSDEGPLGLGYQLEFLDDAAQATPMTAELAQLDAAYEQARAAHGAVNDAVLNRAMNGRGRENTPEIMAERQRLEQATAEAGRRKDALAETLRSAGRWRIDDQTRKIHLYTTIDGNIDRMFLAEYVPFGDDGINPLPTNKEGANWLYAVMGDWMARNGYPGAGSEEEFFRNWLTRKAAGTALVALGTIEMFGGVTVAFGSGGMAAAGGVALTVVGFDTLSQGAKMLWTPDRHAGERGWIGDLVHATAMHFGGEGTAQKFDRGWAVTQIVAGLGAPVVIRYAAKHATRVAASGKTIRPITDGQLDKARLAIVEVKGHKFGHGLVGDYSPLPSGRGAIVNFDGVGKMRLPALDSDMRVLLRLRRATTTSLQARFARLSRHQGPGIVNDKASATKLLEKAADHCGVDLWKYVDEVQYGPPTNPKFTNPNFTVEGRLRIIRLPSTISQENKYMQLKIAAHEINHARIYDKLLARHGHIGGHDIWVKLGSNVKTYAREEIVVERAAQLMIRSVFEGKLTGVNLKRLTQAINDSEDYIAHYKTLM
ncbi:MAG: hypothetical protein Q4G26_07145 [Paracoccus sp. (in: a-proteobacteria)]|nr:hypothetical protein [Paracoccus sp. (in: a-proteobacteria)]